MLVIIKRQRNPINPNAPYYRAYKVVNGNDVDLYIGGIWQSDVIKNVKSDLGASVKVVCQY